jgi:hypothetical protein
MQTPIWQFWTDLSVKALGTVGTFLAVFVALFSSRLQRWMFPPRLIIKLSNADGVAANRYNFDSKTNTSQFQTSGFWYHVQVINETRWNSITRVHIFLLSIEAPDASGEFKPIWEGHAALGWRHEPNPEPKVIGYPAECDLCSLLSGN